MRNKNLNNIEPILINELTVGEQIYLRRKILKIWQKDLSLRLGISQTYLSQIENNIKNPGLKLLQKISNIMKFVIKIEPNNINNLKQ